MPSERGYALFAALVAIVLIGLASVGALHNSALDAQREREDELLFVGNEYRQALRRYLETSPGVRQYPQRLDELIDDRRGPTVQRHLRRLYRDPFTGRSDWILIAHGGRIVGVASSSDRAPLRQGRFDEADAAFAGARSYREWRFLAADGAVGAPVPQDQKQAEATGVEAGPTVAEPAPTESDVKQ